MCILIWRGRFCVIDEALDSNQLVIGAQLLNNAFIRPCDVFNGSPLQCKYVGSALMSLLWASPGKMARLTLWHCSTICLVYTQLVSQKSKAQKFLQIVILVIMLISMCPMERSRIHVFVLPHQLVFSVSSYHSKQSHVTLSSTIFISIKKTAISTEQFC